MYLYLAPWQGNKMTGETPEVRSDKRKLREDSQNHVDTMDLIEKKRKKERKIEKKERFRERKER